MAKKELSLILDNQFLKTLKKYAFKDGISIEEYIIKALEEFNSVK